VLFGPDGIGVNGGRGELGVSEPALHKVERDARLHGRYNHSVAQSLGRGMNAFETGVIHHVADAWRVSKSGASQTFAEPGEQGDLFERID
jgi:hypothetical protein